jgi:hypothetical protein
MNSRRLLLVLGAFAGFGTAPVLGDASTIDDVAGRVRLLEERLARIERALGITEASPASEEPLPRAVQDLKEEVTALRTQVAAVPAPAPAGSPAVTSKWATSLYGYVKLDAIYDTQKTSAGDVAFFVLPEVAGRKDNEFNMTARETRLGFKLQAPEAGQVKASATVELDFAGGGSANSALPRLRLAYADVAWKDWVFRAGQDWEPFITVLPKSLDLGFLADQGALGLRRAQLRATRRFTAEDKSAWETRLAVVRTIGQDLDGGGQDDGVDAGLPTLQWNVFHERASGLKLGLSGHWGREDVERPSGGLHDGFSTWSAIGSFVLPFSPKVSLQGTLWTGANLDTYFGGVGQGVNRALGRSIDATGGFLQLVLNPTPKLNLNFTAGLDDPENDDLAAGMRSANRHLSTTLFYSWTPAVRTALGLTDLQTSYLGQADASTLRVHSALYFGF